MQYSDLAKEIQKELSTFHEIVSFKQILGCSQPKFSRKPGAVLLISDGKFHAMGIAIESKLPIYVYNNLGLQEISQKEIETFEKKQKVNYLKYLNADTVGVMVSSKPGQQNFKRAINFKNNSKKKSYLFLANNINNSEFENFPQIQSWVNTACRRMDMNDSRIINLDKIVKHLQY